MGIKILNSQGTKVYVLPVPTTTPIFDNCADAIGAIQAGKMVGCPQSIGDMSETRTSTEYRCLSSNESAKAMGAISRGNLELGLLLSPDDLEGQGALRTAFKNNEQVVIGIELPNNPSLTPEVDGNGTIYYFVADVSGVSTGIAMDSAITYTVTLEIGSEIKICPALPIGTDVPPTGLTVPTFLAIVADAATINWTAPTGGGVVSKFLVAIEEKDGGTLVQGSPFTVDKALTTLDVSGLTPSTAYNVIVTAESVSGNAHSPTGVLTTIA